MGRAWHQRFAADRARLHALFPAAFPPKGRPRPALAIGVHRALVASGAMTAKEAATFMRAWTGRPRYLRAVAAGGMRVGLDGQPAGEIAPEHLAHALTRLAERGLPLERPAAQLVAEVA